MIVSTLTELLYITFALGAVFSGFMVISSTNPVHSIFSLVLAFANTSALLLMLGVEFMALLFIIVYVGAIAILFLFVVMMLNIKLVEFVDNAARYAPVGVIIGPVVFLGVILDAFQKNVHTLTRSSSDFIWTDGTLNTHHWGDIKGLGLSLFTQGATPSGHPVAKRQGGSLNDSMVDLGGSENPLALDSTLSVEELSQGRETFVLVASLILFVAMVGAIVMTLSHEKGIKRQDLFSQVHDAT